MRVLFEKFLGSEDGASLVEYAVALIVVTIIGGAGVIAIGQNAGSVTGAACDTTRLAIDALPEGSTSSTAEACPGGVSGGGT